MAEELKCMLMSTPGYKTKSPRAFGESTRHWSPDLRLASDIKNLWSDPVSGVMKDNARNPHPWDTPNSSPRTLYQPSPLTSSPIRLPAHSSLPSPADRVTGRPGRYFAVPSFPVLPDEAGTQRSDRSQRAVQLGVPSSVMEASFEGNQSFPKTTRPRLRPDPTPGDVTLGGVGRAVAHRPEDFQGTGVNDVSFSGSQPSRKYFPQLKDIPATVNKSLSDSWSFSGFLGNTCADAFPSTVRNPNKAICTIAADTSEILTANDMACELFGYEETELVGQLLKDRLRLKSKQQETVSETHLEPSGQIVSLAGKVVEVQDSHGLVLPVSLWVKRVEDGIDTTTTTAATGRPAGARKPQPRLLCVMEPVERTVGHLQFDSDGEIQWCDEDMAQLCGYTSPQQISGLHMQQLIPAFLCPDPSQGLTKEVKKQRATGRTRDGMSFPLSIVVQAEDQGHDKRWIPPDQEGPQVRTGRAVYQATVWVFANISGMIALRPDGTIHSLNDNFARLLFGYRCTELVGQSISKLIPDFFDVLELDVDSVRSPPAQGSEGGNISASSSTNCVMSQTENGAVMSRGLHSLLHSDSDLLFTSTPCRPQDLTASAAPEPSLKARQRLPWQSEEEIGREGGQPMPSDHWLATGQHTVRAGSQPWRDSSHHSSSDHRAGTGLRTARTVRGDGPQRTPPDPRAAAGQNGGVVDSGNGDGDTHCGVSPPASAGAVPFGGAHSDRHGDVCSPVCNTSDSATCQNTLGKTSDSAPCQDAARHMKETASDSYRSVVERQANSSHGDSDKNHRGLVENHNNSNQAHVSDFEKTPRGILENLSNLSRTDSEKSQRGILVDIQNFQRAGTVKDSREKQAGEDTKDSLHHLHRSPGFESSNTPTLNRVLLSPCDNGDGGDVPAERVWASPVKSFNQSQQTPCSGSDGGEGDAHPPVETVCAAMSPVKSFRASLLTLSLPSSRSDSASSSTTELLAAKVALCSIADLSSQDEGQADASGAGVVADVSGNIDDTFGSVNYAVSPVTCGDGRGLPSVAGSSQGHAMVTGDPPRDSSSSTSSEEDPCLLPTIIPGPSQAHSHSSGHTSQHNESSSLSAGCTTGSEPLSPSLAVSTDSKDCSDTTGRQMPIQHSGQSPMEGQVTGTTGGQHMSPHSLDTVHPPRPAGGQARIPEGSFSGQGRHKDGGSMGVVFQIRHVTLTDGSEMMVLWLSRDPEDVCERSHSHGNLTLASSFSSALDQSQHSLGELLQEQATSESKLADIQETEAQVQVEVRNQTPDPQDSPQDDECPHEVSLASAGDYNHHYQSLTTIGKGAFGFVKLARRRWPQQEERVVVKFIRRAKVLRESWVKDDKMGMIPMEVFLLSRLHHPNIVKVLEVFQNKDFIQLVMERHGCGMDLFEFIDRNPHLDEPLTSFIFRQMVSAVAYLHSQNIVHRDIKDENIIINEHFNIKLIDFGAAAYMMPGRLFGTFCGTIEYCSPEVLKGNKYRGPELEMWSLGITLYTLTFGENPFFDVEETLRAVLTPPAQVSRALRFLITWLLHPDPLCRATITDAERNAWVNQTVDPSLYSWDTVLPNTEFYGNTACDNRDYTPDTSRTYQNVTDDSVSHGHSSDDGIGGNQLSDDSTNRSLSPEDGVNRRHCPQGSDHLHSVKDRARSAHSSDDGVKGGQSHDGVLSHPCSPKDSPNSLLSSDDGVNRLQHHDGILSHPCSPKKSPNSFHSSDDGVNQLQCHDGGLSHSRSSEDHIRQDQSGDDSVSSGWSADHKKSSGDSTDYPTPGDSSPEDDAHHPLSPAGVGHRHSPDDGSHCQSSPDDAIDQPHSPSKSPDSRSANDSFSHPQTADDTISFCQSDDSVSHCHFSDSHCHSPDDTSDDDSTTLPASL